ncbi:MAG: hypothetical protein HQK85_03215 [Nitrospinae bacterium]|nr:hypothetical protein [Nitrospinota bacterium]
MEKELKVTCPGCNHVLIVDRITGAVLEVRKALVEQPSGDRFADALQKTVKDKEKADSIFNDLKARQDRKKKAAEEIFDASLKDAALEPGEKPRNIFDLD